MKKYFLTDAEFDVLNHISSEAKMDWFYIYDKRDGSTGFKDLEAGTYRSLRIGVAEMDEARLKTGDVHQNQQTRSSQIARGGR